MQDHAHAEAEKRAGRVGVGWVHILFRAKNLSPRQEELILRNNSDGRRWTVDSGRWEGKVIG
jgi:hypothetical protein